MRILLTDKFCDRAKSATAQTDYFDAKVPGLALRVGRTKSWTFHFTRNGKRARLTFGQYPTMSLAAARGRVLEIKTDLAEGRDPVVASGTLQAIADDYWRRDGSQLRSRDWQERTLSRLVYPTLGPRPIGDIRRTDIIRLLDRIEDENGPVMARSVLAAVRRIMNWHASRSDDYASPIVRGMTRGRAIARDRVLTDDEIRRLWNVEGDFGRYLRFLLLTSARRTEASHMAWAEIRNADWTLPAARNKTKLDLVRPLSALAVAQLPSKTGPLVFGSIAGNIKGHKRDHFDIVRLHDIRRTARSLMSRAGVNSDIAERCLGHVIGGVRGIYDRHEYHDEKKRAFEALAAQIERIVHPQENIVPMGR